MESWSRQATERETTHLPLGERPPRTHRASTGQDQDSAVTCWYG